MVVSCYIGKCDFSNSVCNSLVDSEGPMPGCQAQITADFKPKQSAWMAMLHEGNSRAAQKRLIKFHVHGQLHIKAVHHANTEVKFAIKMSKHSQNGANPNPSKHCMGLVLNIKGEGSGLWKGGIVRLRG